MVDQINKSSVNQIAANVLSKSNQAQALENSDTQAAKQAKGYGNASDGSTKTSISQKARMLAQAVTFGRQVPESASVIADTRVNELKALFETGGPAAVLGQYDTNDVADSLLKSSLAAFLR